MLLLSVLLLGACKKESIYYNYSNDLQSFQGSGLAYLRTQPNFDSLYKVIDRLEDVGGALERENVTFFALTNRSFELAFQNLNKVRERANKTPIYVDDVPLVTLDTLMKRYLFAEEITTESLEDVKDGAFFASQANDHEMHVQYRRRNAMGYLGGGSQQLVFTEPNGSIFERYWERTYTISVNIQTNNAVIHVLSPDHNFGFGLLNSVDY